MTLSGTGVAPPGVSLSPVATMAFAATGVGRDAAAQTVTLTNNGGMPLSIQSVGVTGDFAIVAAEQYVRCEFGGGSGVHDADAFCADGGRCARREF